MKTKLLALFGILIMLGGSFTACDSDSDSLRPIVPEGKNGEELRSFFDEHLQMIASSIFSLNDKFRGEESCIMINSIEEFKKIDLINDTPIELPAIDFDSYTLIIGDYSAPSTNYSLVDQSVVVKSRKVTMYIRVEASGYGFTIPLMKSYWGLYSKLPQGSIDVVRK